MKTNSSLSLAFIIIFSFLPLVFPAYQNTQNCNPTTCQLPDCYCPSFDIPGNLALNDTPQFIFFTFDDSMYESDYNRMGNYSFMLNNLSIVDSIGCPLKVSWYALEICTHFNINFLKKPKKK